MIIIARRHGEFNGLCDQVDRQVVGAVEVADGDVPVLDVYAGDGAVIEQEPGFQSVGGVFPGQVEDGAHQVHEEPAVADEDDTRSSGWSCLSPWRVSRSAQMRSARS